MSGQSNFVSDFLAWQDPWAVTGFRLCWAANNNSVKGTTRGAAKHQKQTVISIKLQVRLNAKTDRQSVTPLMFEVREGGDPIGSG